MSVTDSCFLLGLLLVIGDFRSSIVAQETTPTVTRPETTVNVKVNVSVQPENSSVVDASTKDEEDDENDDDDVIKTGDAEKADEAEDRGDVSVTDDSGDDVEVDVGSEDTSEQTRHAVTEHATKHNKTVGGRNKSNEVDPDIPAGLLPLFASLPASKTASDIEESLTSSAWSANPPVDFAALKADHELMHSLTDYLGRFGIQMPKALINRVDQTDLCAETSVGGLKYYCLKMSNGQYYDPWNPWCGFIECHDGVATRRVCEQYTWMGMGLADNLLMSKNDMCRRRLSKQLVGSRCIWTTEFTMCNETKQMETTGSPTTSGVTSLKEFVRATSHVVQR